MATPATPASPGRPRGKRTPRQGTTRQAAPAIQALRSRRKQRLQAREAFYSKYATGSERRQARGRGETPRAVIVTKGGKGGPKKEVARHNGKKPEMAPTAYGGKTQGGTAEALAKAAHKAGFRGAALAKAVAVGMAESKGSPTAVGDTHLQDQKWGPSVGAWQIRTLNAERGTGGTRDFDALMGDLDAQAKRAFEISSRGANWSPWTVHKTGADRRYSSEAERAASFWNR